MDPPSVYLEDIPLDEARSLWQDTLNSIGRSEQLQGEGVPLHEAIGRITAEPVWAKLSSPHYHAAAMDGYAVSASDTDGSTETSPILLPVPQDATYVDTGNPMPDLANAVIPIEDVQETGNPPYAIEIRSSTSPWRHVRAMGEDMVATELVLPANHTLRAVDLGAIAGCGHSQVIVRRRPTVAVIPTGTELVPPGSAVQPGDILEYNSLMLAAQVEQWGGLPTRWPIVPDQQQAITEAVYEAAKNHDLILLNAGSSRGSQDFSAAVIKELGTVLVHGVAVRPGHPVILGTIKMHSPASQEPAFTPIIGVPGYPVSAALTGEIFVEPLLSHWLGRRPAQPPTLQATLTRKVLSPAGDDEFMRVSVANVGKRTIATPQSRGAGIISSMVRADGIVQIPRFSEGFPAGHTVTVHLYRSQQDIENTLLAIGSHDLTLDLLGQYLALSPHRVRFASSNAGSIGGLIALRRKECHVAGIHLLEPETGDYNTSYVRKYLPRQPIRLVTLVHREQGLIIANGNPKRLSGLTDLARKDVRLVNRQRGAGTRLLLDYELNKIGLTPHNIAGYEHQEYTHLALAAAVSSGIADCGLGIRAAASALDLDFLPMSTERYDLAIPQEYLGSQLLDPLIQLMVNSKFRHAVNSIPGYCADQMGEALDVLPSNL